MFDWWDKMDDREKEAFKKGWSSGMIMAAMIWMITILFDFIIGFLKLIF